MPKLIIQHAGEEWTVELKQGSNVVGRQSTCDVPLKEGSLSRQHCDVVLAGSTAILVDKGSMNGTLVNGKKVKEQALQPGDRIVLGQATLWYERKAVAPQQVQSRPAPSPRAAVPTPDPDPSEGRPAAPTAQVATRRAVSPSKPVAGLPADFAFRSSAGGGGAVKAAVAVLVLALFGAGAWFVRGLFTTGPAAKGDTGGLVRNGSFEGLPAGKASGWSLLDKPVSSLAVDATQGKGGGACLALDKSSSPGDHSVSAVYDEVFPLSGAGTVDASLQTRFDGFGGRLVLRVEWLRSLKGPVLAEEGSDPVSKIGDWTALSASFVPPSGAAAFRVGVTASGRGGRILIDDVSVRKGPGGPPEKEHRIGTHFVRPTKQGVLQVGLRGQYGLLNVMCRLESEKDGAVAQTGAYQVTPTVQENLLVFGGKLASAADGRDIEFEEQVGSEDGGTTVRWSFRGEPLLQVERYSVGFTLPKGAAAPDAETLAQPRERATIRCDEGEVALRFLNPARLSVRPIADGRLRLYASWTSEGEKDEVVVAFNVRDASAGAGSGDPMESAGRLIREGKPGEAQSILKGYLQKVKEQALRDKVEQQLKSLEESERREWAEVQASVFQASMFRRSESVDRARAALAGYARQWTGEPYDSKLAGLRTELGGVVTGSEAEAERASKILDRAKGLGQAGKRLQAELLARTVVVRYPATEAAEGAKEFLKTLSP
jgi:hypothetical protein